MNLDFDDLQGKFSDSNFVPNAILRIFFLSASTFVSILLTPLFCLARFYKGTVQKQPLAAST